MLTKPLFYLAALGVLALVAVLALSVTNERVLSDGEARQAVQLRLPVPAKMCFPTYADLGQTIGLPTTETTSQEVADLTALGLVEADPELTTSEQLVLHPTAKGQPFVQGSKVCLAQYSYGHLKSVADQHVTEGGQQALVAKIEPKIEALSGVPEAWLKQIYSISAVRGMDAEMVQQDGRWQANHVSLY